MMDRRHFIAGATLNLLAAPMSAKAQQTGNIPRIGMLLTFPPEHPQARELSDAFRQGLRELGYVEGQNIVFEYRSAQDRPERLPELFVELVRLKVNLVFALGGTPAARAAKQANITIPVVAPGMADPVSDGLIASLARPGGNITGSTFLGPGLVPKRVELLKEAVPGAARVAALWHPGVYGDRDVEGDRRCGPAVGPAASTPGGPRAQRFRQGILRDDKRARGRPHRSAEPDVLWRAQTHRRPREKAPATGNIRIQGGRGGGRTHGLWGESS
jgi:hypothetical protein